jgi:protein SCO1/2
VEQPSRSSSPPNGSCPGRAPAARVAAALVAAAALLLVAAAGCNRRSNVYHAHGVVESVDRPLQQVVIAHEDIPGLMPAMTMNFDVPDPALLDGLVPGQAIEFDVEFTGTAYRVIRATPSGEGGAGHAAGGATLERVAALRDPAPPFRLIDQDGSPFALESLRGKAVLLDFVYTECPGPCPILTGLHADVQRALAPAVRARSHFVSISLDPLRDTPTALKAYARKRGADLAGWSFLTGPPEEVERVIAAYGVGSARQPDGTIAHLVVSFVIDGEGRIAERFVGLEHEVDEIARAIERVAGPPADSSPGG